MQKIQTTLIKNQTETNSSNAHTLFQKSGFGTKSNQKIIYSSYETFYLTEKNQIEVQTLQDKPISKQDLLKKFTRTDKNFPQKYQVYKNLTELGYLVKTALKFGADFRVYQKKSTHSKWICYVTSESEKNSWQEFAAKNRVAHSCKKTLLLAIVDQENSITYYEVNWTKP